MSLFHRHNWSDWSISERGRVVDAVYTKEVVGSYIVQDRFCRSCGKHQMKQQRTGSVRRDVRLVADVRPAHRAPQKDTA